MVQALKSKPKINHSPSAFHKAALFAGLPLALASCSHTAPEVVPVKMTPPHSSAPLAADFPSDRAWKVGDGQPVIMPNVPPDGTKVIRLARVMESKIFPRGAAVVEILDSQGNVERIFIEAGTSVAFSHHGFQIRVDSVDTTNSSASIEVESFPK
ncbi:MAG TPA: hypothetical protein VJH24_02280 [Candidatus Bilamarchaeaceae archaeon]|nr:hypothetical protein [Candidatus Bilamarchaeaceae archaeon]